MCTPNSTLLSYLCFVFFFFLSHSAHCNLEYLLRSRRCLCLSAGVNVHRHADCLRLPVTHQMTPCEPVFCCFFCFFFYGILCAFHSTMSVYCYFYIVLFVGSNIIYPQNIRYYYIITWLHVMCPAMQSAPLNLNSIVNHWNIQPFLPQQGLAQAVKMHLFSFSIFSHVCAISFVSFLPGSKSLEHNGPCLGLDNSHYEWEWKRGEQWGETGSSHQSALNFCDVSHFIKPFVFHLFTYWEDSRGSPAALLPQQV